MKVSFTVPGLPIGKGRPRITKNHAYTPKKTKDYEKLVRESWLTQSGYRFDDEARIAVLAIAYFPIPRAVAKKRRPDMYGTYYAHKPDLDNILKIICDALNGVAYKDDAYVILYNASKLYVNSDDEMPRVEITLTDVAG